MSSAIHAHLLAFAMDVLRVAVWLFLLGVVFVPLERLFAEKPQPTLRRQFADDLAYYFGNSLLTAALLASVTGVLAAALHRVVPDALLTATAGLTLWQRMLATLVVGEFGFYWGHRWSHEIPLLWRFHAIHHSAEQVDWLTSTRGHPVDVIFTRLCGFSLIYLAGLGQPSGGGAGGVVVPLLTIFTMLWGFFIHANVKWRLGWLESVIATPGFHRWHHTRDANRDRNYASTLPIYDRLFGTLHLPRYAAPQAYGIDTPMPSGLLAQLLHPLEARRDGMKPRKRP